MVSALDWWRDAGVDVLVEDAPRDWTARAPAPQQDGQSRMGAPRAAPPEPDAPAPLPATIRAFVDWRYAGAAPEAALGEPLIGPEGDPGSALMVVTDLPDHEADVPALLGGAAGRLFDRMLAAIGHSRESIYLVPLCAARPITGQVPRELEERLAELLRHHVALAAPARLLLLGQSASRAILGTYASRNSDGLRPINHLGAETQAVATFHPRFLLSKPMAKGDAWKDLQRLIGDQGQ